VHDTDFAPVGTSPSAMRLTVPHAAQVASIIRRKLYLAYAARAGSYPCPTRSS
jgi:hypothetical protein